MDGISCYWPELHPPHPADGLIPHRPVIDGQKLLADSLGNGVLSCAGAAGEDDAFHEIRLLDTLIGSQVDLEALSIAFFLFSCQIPLRGSHHRPIEGKPPIKDDLII